MDEIIWVIEVTAAASPSINLHFHHIEMKKGRTARVIHIIILVDTYVLIHWSVKKIKNLAYRLQDVGNSTVGIVVNKTKPKKHISIA